MKLSNSQTMALLLAAAVLSLSSAFSLQTNPSNGDPSLGVSDRRNFVQQASLVFGVTLLPNSPALAAEDVPLPTREVVTNTFAPIKYELNDPNGGVAIMQERIDQQDWAGLMDFTKTYDLEMRKIRMGMAKKLMQDKELKLKATGFANAVTFDLIGINRNSRSGQENVEEVNKYLQELRDDVKKFLELESVIEVEG